ncbi:MAG: RHS repeat-associated core domain-containing protein, partial [Planctomycetes bacterium]|nr:RHS repeat-associated core domain-containing protein [Planctomycetota bacterium]
LRAVTQTGTAGAKQESYTYDTAGNTLTRTREGRSQDLAWDVEGRLESVTEDSQKTSYVYNAEGERLIRRDPTGTTLYLNGTEIRLAKAGGAVTGTRYYTFDERTVAARTTRGVSFFTSDQQGTAQVQVDATSMAVTRRRLTPFGQERGTAAQGWVGERGFVNGTSDDSTGLIHLGAREYDPLIGRFISVDPLFDTEDPLSWNGYAYADSNPVTFNDADGQNCHSVESCAAMYPAKKKTTKKTKPKTTKKASRISTINNINRFVTAVVSSLVSAVKKAVELFRELRKDAQLANVAKKRRDRIKAEKNLKKHGTPDKYKWARAAGKSKLVRFMKGLGVVGGIVTFATHYYNDEYALEAAGNTAIEVGAASVGAAAGMRAGASLGAVCGPGAPYCMPAFAVVGGAGGSYGGALLGEYVTGRIKSWWHPTSGRIQGWIRRRF